MTGYEIGCFIGIGFLGIGLITTWARNSRSQTRHMSEMEGRQSEQMKGVTDQLAHPVTGLGAIAQNVSEQKERCAGVVGGFTERFKGHEGRLKALEEGKKD